MEELEMLNTQINAAGFIDLLLHFTLNIIAVGIIVGRMYYPQSKRRDYSFTFLLISISIFLMIFLLGSVKIQIGFALGLFAIFGIIRYRTEQMPVREMTYLFVIISMSVINALSVPLPWVEVILTNVIFIVAVWLIEGTHWIRHISNKTIRYDRIDLITPDRRAELIADLEARTGLKIVKLRIGDLDFLKDMAIIQISYESENGDFSPNNNDNLPNVEINTSDGING